MLAVDVVLAAGGAAEGGAVTIDEGKGKAALALGTGGTSIPINAGFLQMITAMPTAVTRRSAAMNARSFCFGDGVRLRTTIVADFCRFGWSGLTGRSGIRIVK